MHAMTQSFSTHLIRLVMFLLLVMFLSAGCGSSSSDGTPGGGDTPSDPALNTSYYGTYNVSVDVGGCDKDYTLTVGNDALRAQDDDYIYLPEDGDINGVDGITVTRDGLTVTASLTKDTSNQTIILTFAEDLLSATISGTVSDDDTEECAGDVSGTLTLVTKTPAKISDAFLQYRYFADGTDTHVAWIPVSRDGSLLGKSEFDGVPRVIDDEETALETESQEFYSSEYRAGIYNSETMAVDFAAELTPYAGYLLTTKSAFTQGDYTLSASVKEGDVPYTIKKTISYPGDPIEDMAAITGLTADMVITATAPAETKTVGDYGDITITWDALTEPEDVYVTIMKQDRIFMEIKVLAPAETDTDAVQTTSVTIPADQVLALLNLADTISTYDLLTVQLQTRRYTDGLNNVRTYSDRVAIPGTGTGDDYDNSDFYGTYAINYAGDDTPSLTIGNNPKSACFDDYLYLPSGTLTYNGDCVSVTRDADTLTVKRDGETRIFTFNHDKNHADVSPSGTAELITRTPAVVQFASLKSIYESDHHGIVEYDRTEACMALMIGDRLITQQEFDKLLIFDDTTLYAKIENISTDKSLFQKQSYFSGTVSGKKVSLNAEKTEWAGALISLEDIDSTTILVPTKQTDATFQAWVSAPEGTYTVSTKVSFPGRESTPMIEGGFELNNDTGNYDISWMLPQTKFDELHVNLLKYNSSNSWDTYLLTLPINHISSISPISITPSDLLAVLGDLAEGEEVFIEFQSCKLSLPEGMVYSSQSTYLDITDDIPVQ